MKQKSRSLEKGMGRKNGSLSGSISQLQVKFVFSLVVLFYTWHLSFSPLKEMFASSFG